jgi:hypothetical protein
MKRFLVIILLIAFAAGLAWVVRQGFALRQGEHEAGAPESVEGEPEPGTVKIEPEQQKLLGLAFAHPTVGSRSAQARAYGRVLDPSPLAALSSELDAAESALAASRAESDRAESLFRAGENVARKSVEASAAQFRADTIKTEGLRQRLILEWGADLAGLDAESRRHLIASLVNGSTALVRADLPAGDTLSESPTSARVFVLGKEDQPLSTTHLAPASTVDPKTQAQSFILRVEAPAFPLRPGMALIALLALPGEAVPVFIIPRSAVVRHEGKAWVFVRQGEDEFTRREVVLDEPADDGWLVGGGVTAEETVVVTGAMPLLSREILGAAGGAKD